MAGQVPRDRSGTVVGIDDPKVQARQVWQNIKDIVEFAGGNLDNVVRTVHYFTDLSALEAELEVRREMFPSGRYPCVTLLEVSRLGRPEFILEIEATAYLPGSEQT